MKKTLLTATIALASLAAFNTVNAQTPVSWVSGDVLLGFENAAQSKDLLVDLGNGASFASALSGNSFSSINLNADLISTFGSDWSTNATTGVSYGVFGLPASKAIVYASVASGNTAPVLKSSALLGTALTHYDTLGAGYNNDIATQGLTVGVYQNVGTAPDKGFATWSGNSPSVAPFATYNVSFENAVAGNLDIYGTTGTTSTLEGSLTIGTNGVVSAVPEPSTYALFGFGALLLIVAYRRKNA